MAAAAGSSAVTAHFLANGTLDPAFAPAFTGAVWTLARAENTLYVGGSFTTINGVTRNRAAAFDIAGLSILPWHPNVGAGTVQAIELSGPRVFIGGTFAQVSGTNRQNLAAVDAGTGALQSFVAHTTGQISAGSSRSSTGRRACGRRRSTGTAERCGPRPPTPTTPSSRWLRMAAICMLPASSPSSVGRPGPGWRSSTPSP